MGGSPNRRNRKSIRLKNYDYTQPGAYFVTICTQNRTCLFGEIVEYRMKLNSAGKMVSIVWHEIPSHYPGVEIDAFVVMPNHIHGIIILLDNISVGAVPCDRPKIGQPQGVAPILSLPEVSHRFKTMTTKRYVDGVKNMGWPPFSTRLWQRNYWEHVIRNECTLDIVRRNIQQDSMRWDLDRYNKDAGGLNPLAKELWKTLQESARHSSK